MASAVEPRARVRDVANNRKARHLYQIIETFEAGIELRGSEVKSIKDGHASIGEAFCMPSGTQLLLKGMHVQPYEKAAAWTEPVARDRRLLMKRREIERLAGAVSQKGMTIVPLRLYTTAKGLIKVEVALCKGKAAPDKRQDLKERTVRRELDREYKVR